MPQLAPHHEARTPPKEASLGRKDVHKYVVGVLHRRQVPPADPPVLEPEVELGGHLDLLVLGRALLRPGLPVVDLHGPAGKPALLRLLCARQLVELAQLAPQHPTVLLAVQHLHLVALPDLQHLHGLPLAVLPCPREVALRQIREVADHPARALVLPDDRGRLWPQCVEARERQWLRERPVGAACELVLQLDDQVGHEHKVLEHVAERRRLVVSRRVARERDRRPGDLDLQVGDDGHRVRRRLNAVPEDVLLRHLCDVPSLVGPAKRRVGLGLGQRAVANAQVLARAPCLAAGEDHGLQVFLEAEVRPQELPVLRVQLHVVLLRPAC
mmetsp:Transcript_20877/g.55293  ORF Transcript_20877/g.55293 Transcript_20877/m.55293 type:complete len:327 (-) Transcript_20877:1700-2680(-)